MIKNVVVNAFIIAALCIVAAAMVVPGVSASTYTIDVNEDATIMYGRMTGGVITEDRGDRNYGGTDSLLINRGGSMDNNQKAYIKFLLPYSGLNSPALTSAQLQFTVTDTNGGGVKVYGLTGNDDVYEWEEGTGQGTAVDPLSKWITWNNAPGNQVNGYGIDTAKVYGGTSLDTVAACTTGINTVDVTNYIRGLNGKNAAFIVIASGSGSTHDIASKENAGIDGPKLVVEINENDMSLIKNTSYALDVNTLTISNVANGIPLDVFLSNIEVYDGAQKLIVEKDGITPVNGGAIRDGMKLKVISASGKETTYTINGKEYIIEDIQFNINDEPVSALTEGNIVASVEVQNYSGNAATFIMAVYHQSQLIQCIVDSKKNISGKATLSCSANIMNTDGVSMKAMLWEGMESQIPLCDAKSLVQAPKFKHPGILQSQSDLDFMKAAVNGTADHPMKAGYDKMAADSHAGLGYIPHAYSVVHVFSSGVGEEENHLRDDAHAAYAHALRWVATGDPAYKDKSIEILNTWADTCTDIVGDTNNQATLEVSWALPLWAGAAEIIRFYDHGSAGWTESDIKKFKTFILMLKSEVDEPCSSAPNWRASRGLARMAAGVFLDDWELYRRGYAEADYQIGHIGSDGTPSENFRDSGHCQYNIIATSQAAEIALQQGDLSLYNKRLPGEADTVKPLLWRQSEYFVREMLGNIPPGGVDYTAQNKRNPPYEMLLARYTNLFSLPMPYTEQFITNYNRPVDVSERHFIGWTTLTHAGLNP